MSVNIDRTSLRPLYEQIYLSLRNDIVSGRLAANERLPSKRRLAERLDVSVMTVQNAYAQLISEGYVYTRERAGLYVARVDIQRTGEPAAVRIPHRPPSPPVLDLSSGGTDPALFPFSVFARYMRQTLAEREEVLLARQDAHGTLALRSAIAAHLGRFRGMNVSPEQIVIGAGTEVLYGLLIQLFGQERVYGVENPGYAKILRVAQAAGVRCRPLPIDGEGLSSAAVAASDAEILHLSPSHHYPTGTVMSAARRHALLSWASEGESRYLIEDDYDSDFRLSGRPTPSLFSLDTAERVVYLNTFSRSIAPSVRIGYMVLPPRLLARFDTRLGFYSGTVSAFEELTLARFIMDGAFERHLYRLRKHYRGLRDELLSALAASRIAPAVSVRGADAGLHFLLSLRTDAEDSVLRAAAADAGLSPRFLSEDCFDAAAAKAYAHTLLVNYAGVRRESIPSLVLALERWLLPYLCL